MWSIQRSLQQQQHRHDPFFYSGQVQRPIASTATTMTMSLPSSRWYRRCGLIQWFHYSILTIALIVGLLYLIVGGQSSSPFPMAAWGTKGQREPVVPIYSIVPEVLLDRAIYQSSDFQNEIGRIPPFWEEWKDGTSNNTISWGPCYPPRGVIHWEQEINDAQNQSEPKYDREKPSIRKRDHADPNSVNGRCRPGFLIIGAGKCGTSSLYHYLNGHPRVVPALEKQIHYFKVCWLSSHSLSLSLSFEMDVRMWDDESCFLVCGF